MSLVAFLALIAAMASAAAFFGNLWPPLDLLANFRPHLVVLCLASALVLARRQWWKAAAVGGVGTLLNLLLILPLFLGPSRPEDPDGLRVMTFNILSTNMNYEQVIDFIRVERPDLVILHEVSQPWEEALATAGLEYRITRGRTESLIFGSLVLAPPDARVRSFGFARDSPRAIEVLLPSGVAVLGIHPLAPFPDSEAEARRFQFEFAALWALGQDGPRVVMGDFNAGPWSYPFRRLRATTGLLNSQRGYGLELSYPASSHPVLQVSIDHVLHSSDLAVIDRRLGPALGSDHFPVVVDLVQAGSAQG